MALPLAILLGVGSTAINAYAAYKKGEISEAEYRRATAAADELERKLKTLRPDDTWESINPQLLTEAAKYSPDIAGFVEENAPQLIQEADSATEKRIQRQALQSYAAQAETGRDVISEAQQEQALFEKDKKETDKYQGSKGVIELERAKDEGTSAQEKAKSDKNIAQTKDLVKQTSDNYSSSSNVDNEQITKADNGLHDANVTVSSNTAASVEAEKVNTVLMQDLTKSMKDDVSKDLIKQDDKHYKAQESIHDKQKELEPKPIVKNAIGSQYPEGVSQESFTQKDQNGLMTSIITRRIVVIEGKGNVYVRTQTLQATTYSKNNQPISEYVWQKETQGSNLKRNY